MSAAKDMALWYREQAALLHARAEKASDPDIQFELRRTALEFEALAHYVETREHHKPERG